MQFSFSFCSTDWLYPWAALLTPGDGAAWKRGSDRVYIRDLDTAVEPFVV